MSKRSEFESEVAGFLGELIESFLAEIGGPIALVNGLICLPDEDCIPRLDLQPQIANKEELNEALSTKVFDVHVTNVALDEDAMPVFSAFVFFSFNDKLKTPWVIDDLYITISHKGHHVSNRTTTANEKKAAVKAADTHWDALSKSLQRHKTLHTIEMSA
jgi:hypothetical protein